jgi:hypothetical protein
VIDPANKNFCPAPWISVYVEPNGRVDNCCIGRNNLGNLSEVESIAEILTGPTNIGIQQSMLNNQVVPGCTWCHGGIDGGLETLQVKMLRDFPNKDDPIYQVGSFDLRYLDARWSNTCNLACVYCGPEFSSRWAQELGRTIKIERGDKNNFLQYVLDNVESIKELYLAGGEPLLMKENELLLDELVVRNPDCKLLVNTNLLNINTKIYQRLISMPNVEWLVSFEATGAEYEYLRWPGIWSDFESNLLQLKRDVPVHRILFNMVFLSFNALSIWDTIDWLRDRGFSGTALTVYNNGTRPGPFDPRGLSVEYRNQVIERMQQKDYSNITGYQNVIKSLASTEQISVQFVDTLINIDNSRNLNSRQLFPDVYKSIESNL